MTPLTLNKNKCKCLTIYL
ncbi:hypothetical protein D2A34_26425 [Clostridium chromiireducens]|uniref:Uncharacterized protein n=1 Tax=Clostridium chromiireducens TaxID=225345 RepID=A0A399IK48_9CLOT|nr:hypothetical protein D2A34_26425 [Clostridium chromiireducens]